MEKDTLRRHVYEEIHSQFETKLREAKRQKTQVEEELESLSEKWRSERRRLNTEIDRLEAALADAKDVRKRGGPRSGRATDSDELLKAQQTAEEKLKKASQSWEKERLSLQAEIKRLELGVAEVLERSNNPMRSAQALRESLEAKLEDAVRARQRIEDDYATSKGKWDREKVHFEAELAKLRRLTRSRSPQEEEELQRKLRDALNARKASEEEIAELRKKHGLEIASLQKELKQARDLVGEARIQAEKAADESMALRAATTDHESRLSTALTQTRAEAETARKRLADELARTKEQLESLQKMRSEETALNGGLQDRPAQTAPDAGSSDQVQELMRHRNFLQQQLHQAEETIRVVRAEQSEEFAQLTAQLQEARVETARVRKNLERDLQRAREEAEATRSALVAEIEQLKKLPAQQDAGGSRGSQSEVELQELRRHNDELKRQLRDTKDALATLQEEHSRQRDQLSSQLESLRTKSEQVVLKHKEELRKATGELEALRQKQAPSGGKQGAAEGSTVDGHAYQLREVMQQRNYLQQQVHQAEEAIRTMRAEHATEKQQLMAQLEESRGNAQHLESRLGENTETVSADVVEQLRKQYDQRIQQMTQQKTQLAEELNRASATLEAERKRFATAAVSASGSGGTATAVGVDHHRIHEEVSRVEGVIHGITNLIDDPSVELSTVIRKNVERAEWDAYLKGILFSLGKGNGK